MREKRPRISTYKNQSDKIDENVNDGRLNVNIEMNEGKILSRGKLPDAETDELLKKDYYKQTGITDFQIDMDVTQSDDSKNQQVDSLYDTAFLKDIYNTVDYDHSI